MFVAACYRRVSWADKNSRKQDEKIPCLPETNRSIWLAAQLSSGSHKVEQVSTGKKRSTQLGWIHRALNSARLFSYWSERALHYRFRFGFAMKIVIVQPIVMDANGHPEGTQIKGRESIQQRVATMRFYSRPANMVLALSSPNFSQHFW